VSTAASAAVSGFEASFSVRPEAVFSAPGRVNLIGEHTDYNEGFVLPAAIDRRIYLAVKRRDDASIQLIAGDLGEASSRWACAGDGPIERDPRQAWANYPRGVTEQFRKRSLTTVGLDGYIRSDIPLGAGLSSSAALCVASAYALAQVNRLDVATRDLAEWCQAAEHEYLGSRCGIMDQLASLSGIERHALLIDCRTLALDPVPLPADAAIVIVESGQSHRHADGAYNARRAECEAAASAMKVASLREVTLEELQPLETSMEERIFRRARHVLTENLRTLAMADALASGDYAAIGRHMAGSQESMREDFEISTPEVDALVELICNRLDGEGGARMTGGGFGGSVVALAPEAAASRIDRGVIDRYHRETGLNARIHRCLATSGAKQE
jgi:galactokinase